MELLRPNERLDWLAAGRLLKLCIQTAAIALVIFRFIPVRNCRLLDGTLSQQKAPVMRKRVSCVVVL